MTRWERLSTHIPIWVSRPNANRFIAQYTVPLWLFLLIGLLILLNILLWGCIGIYEAGRVIL